MAVSSSRRPNVFSDYAGSTLQCQFTSKKKHNYFYCLCPDNFQPVLVLINSSMLIYECINILNLASNKRAVCKVVIDDEGVSGQTLHKLVHFYSSANLMFIYVTILKC